MYLKPFAGPHGRFPYHYDKAANSVNPRVSYIICCTPRTGSTLLCEALTETGLCGIPSEHFGRDNARCEIQKSRTKDARMFLRGVFERGTTSNGVFGLKLQMKADFFTSVIEMLRTASSYSASNIPSAQILHETFPNLHYIWLTRRDKVRQAVSWWKAIQTGVWNQRHYSNVQPLVQVPTFSFEKIDEYIQKIMVREAAWENHFTGGGISPLTIVYEDFARSYQVVIKQVMEFLEIDPLLSSAFLPPPLTKQADTTSEEWVKKYLAQKQGA